MANLYKYLNVPTVDDANGASAGLNYRYPVGNLSLPAVAGGNTSIAVIAPKVSTNWAPSTFIFSKATNFVFEVSCSPIADIIADQNDYKATPTIAPSRAIWAPITAAKMIQLLSRVTAIRITNNDGTDPLICQWVL